MSAPSNIGTCSSLHRNPIKTINNNHDATLYHIFPEKTTTRSSKRTHAESNMQAVISSLQTLHSKLMQLEHERDAAVLSEKQLNSQSAKLAQRSLQPSHEDKAPLKALDYYFKHINEESTILEHRIRDILNIIRSKDDVAPPNSEPKTALPTVVTRAKSESLLPCSSNESHTRDSSKRVNKIRIGHHYRLNSKQLPFIMSKATGKTFSLPANIQLFISELKRHNPLLCSLTSDCEATLTNVVSVENDLPKIAKILQNTIGYLTIECHELRKQIVPTDDLRQLESQKDKIDEIMANHDTMLTCIHTVKEFEKKLQHLKKQLNAFNSIPTNGPKGKTQIQGTQRTGQRKGPTTKKPVTTRKPTEIRPSFHNQKQWNDQVVIQSTSKPRLSVDALQYRKLLSVALKRNGLKMKTI